MYRRYSQMNGQNTSLSQIKRNRFRNILILLLAAGLIVLAVFAYPAFTRQKEERRTVIQKMFSECNDAVKLTTTLSRTGGSMSMPTLAQIRSNLYAIKALNDTFDNGGHLIRQEEVQDLLDSVDNYMKYLNNAGMDTGEYQTNLTTSLNALLERLNELE